MFSNLLQFQHTNGPAPSYAIESDSEDDEWADSLHESRKVQPHKIKARNDLLNRQRDLRWDPRPPSSESVDQSGLTLLIGEAGNLVANGFEKKEEFFEDRSILKLGGRIVYSELGRCVLSPNNIPTILQTVLAQKLILDLKPTSLTVISSYSAPTYIPTSERRPIRYLNYLPKPSSDQSSSEWHQDIGIELFQVPNLIRGLEAALITQASFLKIPTKLILFPSTLAIDGSPNSIPVGQYDYSTSSKTSYDKNNQLLSSLNNLLIEELSQSSVKNLIDRILTNKYAWNFPSEKSHVIEKIFIDLNKSSANLSSVKTSNSFTKDHEDDRNNNKSQSMSLMYV